MRFIYLLLITFIFAACGNQKMQFVRTKTKQKVVEIAEVPSIKKKVGTTFNERALPEVGQSEIEQSVGITSATDESPEEVTQLFETTIHSLPKTVEDSTTITPEEATAITQTALKAERDGRSSLLFSILFYAFVVAAIVFLFIAFAGDIAAVGIIGAIISGILAIVSLVLGFVFGIKSLRARYNTLKGKRSAIAGIILSGLAAFLFLLNLAASFF